jgi:NADPH:quinone reductase-like Zn-dependent oxidoreductase
MGGNIMKHKAYSWIGGPRYHFFTVMNNSHMPYVATLLERGITPEIEKVLPIERVAEAHEAIETQHSRGKIVLSVSHDE